MADFQLSPLTTSESADNSIDDNLTHDVCEHDLDTALCGSDVKDANWVETDDDQCVVCADLADYYDQIGTCCRFGEAGGDA